MIVRVTTSLPPEKVNTALPGNFDDSDLSPETIVSPKPDSVLTDISFEVEACLLDVWRKAQVKLTQVRIEHQMLGSVAAAPVQRDCYVCCLVDQIIERRSR